MTRPAPRTVPRLLGATVFVTGLSVMAVEMCGSRLLAPYFGTSFQVWTLLLTVVLATLCLGYTLGGRLADRSERASPFFATVALGGVLTCLVPLIGHGVLGYLAGRSGLEVGWGSLLASLLFVAPPIFLLAMVAPWAVRLRTASATEAARAAGNLYALSTLGSIMGSFLPGLVLLPALGTTKCFLLFGGLLMAVAALGGILVRDERTVRAS